MYTHQHLEESRCYSLVVLRYPGKRSSRSCTYSPAEGCQRYRVEAGYTMRAVNSILVAACRDMGDIGGEAALRLHVAVSQWGLWGTSLCWLLAS